MPMRFTSSQNEVLNPLGELINNNSYYSFDVKRENILKRINKLNKNKMIGCLKGNQFEI